MSAFKIIYMLFGGLGIFFFGMKLMSEALQEVAGDMIKNIINSLTTNKFLAVGVGTLVTMIVQSSSVTTVMVVGFVNAGLMQLSQALGVIFGANIGTTITGWIISIKVGKYGPLFVGVGVFPMLFSNNFKWKNFGKVLFGIGLIFWGLDTMSSAFKPLRSNQEFLDFIAYFNDTNYQSYIASVLVGCVLTFVIQSSSAMLGITMALATTGIIEFPTACALVLGENIGTTVTALLASIGGNINAKRAARGHAIFNLFGVCVMLIIFPWYIEFIEKIIPGLASFTSANGDRPNVASHIAASHSIFNITASVLFLPWLGLLAKIVTRITPDTNQEKENVHLVLLGNPKDILPATAIIQSQEQLKKFREIVIKMFSMTDEYIKGNSKDKKLYGKIKEYETISDNIQKEITFFLCKVMERPLSPEQSNHIQALVRIASEIESVADYLERLVDYSNRLEVGLLEDETFHAEFKEFYNVVSSYFQFCSSSFQSDENFDLDLCRRKSEKIWIHAESIRENHVSRFSDSKYNLLSMITYSDMIVALRKIRAHTLNISISYERIVSNMKA